MVIIVIQMKYIRVELQGEKNTKIETLYSLRLKDYFLKTKAQIIDKQSLIQFGCIQPEMSQSCSLFVYWLKKNIYI